VSGRCEPPTFIPVRGSGLGILRSHEANDIWHAAVGQRQDLHWEYLRWQEAGCVVEGLAT